MNPFKARSSWRIARLLLPAALAWSVSAPDAADRAPILPAARGQTFVLSFEDAGSPAPAISPPRSHTAVCRDRSAAALWAFVSAVPSRARCAGDAGTIAAERGPSPL